MNTNLGLGFAPHGQWSQGPGSSSNGGSASDLSPWVTLKQLANNVSDLQVNKTPAHSHNEGVHPWDLARPVAPKFAPHNFSKANAKTTIMDIPYDVIHIICKSLVTLHASNPPFCANSYVHNKFTNEEELNLVLDSQWFDRIVKYLNTRTAYQDMLGFSFTCKQLYGHVREAMQSLDKVKSLRQPMRVKQIWFEDLSWMTTRLTGFGFQNLTTLQIYWDNRERIANTMCVPAPHRRNQAARGLFITLREKCVGLKTLEIKIAFEMLRIFQADGTCRPWPLATYREIPGIDELKALIQTLRKRKGHVLLSLATDDRSPVAYLQPLPILEFTAQKKQDILTWLQDGEHVELMPFTAPMDPDDEARNKKKEINQEESDIKSLEDVVVVPRWDGGEFDTRIGDGLSGGEDSTWLREESHEGYTTAYSRFDDPSDESLPFMVRSRWAPFDYR
jgi:hypothetical protein